MARANSTNNVFNQEGDPGADVKNLTEAQKGVRASGQYVLDGSSENAATFVKRFLKEVGPCIQTSYDNYFNELGPVRSNAFKKVSPQGLGKIVLIALDSLQEQKANGNQNAETVLKAIRAYDSVAEEQSAIRKAEQAAANLAKVASDAGVTLEEFQNFLYSKSQQPQPIQPAPEGIEEAEKVAEAV